MASEAVEASLESSEAEGEMSCTFFFFAARFGFELIFFSVFTFTSRKIFLCKQTALPDNTTKMEQMHSTSRNLSLKNLVVLYFGSFVTVQSYYHNGVINYLCAKLVQATNIRKT